MHGPVSVQIKEAKEVMAKGGSRQSWEEQYYQEGREKYSQQIPGLANRTKYQSTMVRPFSDDWTVWKLY